MRGGHVAAGPHPRTLGAPRAAAPPLARSRVHPACVARPLGHAACWVQRGAPISAQWGDLSQFPSPDPAADDEFDGLELDDALYAELGLTPEDLELQRDVVDVDPEAESLDQARGRRTSGG
jgi:hypothetical protein